MDPQAGGAKPVAAAASGRRLIGSRAARLALVAVTLAVFAFTWAKRPRAEPISVTPAPVPAPPPLPPPPPEGNSPEEWLAHLRNPQDARETRIAALNKLLRLSPGSLPAVILDLYRNEPAFPDRAALVRALGRFPEDEYTEVLIEALAREPTPAARQAAAGLLYTRAGEASAAALRTAMRSDADRDVRAAALRGLHRMNPPGVEEDLRQAAESDPDSLVQTIARQLLEHRQSQPPR